MADTARTERAAAALGVIATAQLMVVLDATIVNVALPQIQRTLGFSGSGLEWVVNAYAVAFGGLLLLGGRAGDILGRRKMLVLGLALFSCGSLSGGLAAGQAWLLAARAVQGAGAAIVAPTALSLITTTFPEGGRRTRAMAVYSAMSVTGATAGLIAGGLLTTYLSWRWVFFVNVPVGAATAVAALVALAESESHPARFDLPGAVTGTLGLAALVYGLSSVTATRNSVPRWTGASVLSSLAAAMILLAAFVIIEFRTRQALVPPRIFRDRDRRGAYLIMLCLGTAIFGMFFFLSVFMQTVWGYSALRTGVAYVPMTGAIMLMSWVSARIVQETGPGPLLLAGPAFASGGLFWLSRISEHSTYSGGLLGPMILTAVCMGVMFVPLSLMAVSRVSPRDAGLASSLLNTGQQAGGSIGLALLGTVAWSTAANSVRDQVVAAARSGHPVRAGATLPAALTDHALAAGLSRGLEVAAGVALLAMVPAIATIRRSGHARADDQASSGHGSRQIA
jgi:EmrB/QacA subfamily drug resistance transporter